MSLDVGGAVRQGKVGPLVNHPHRGAFQDMRHLHPPAGDRAPRRDGGGVVDLAPTAPAAGRNAAGGIPHRQIPLGPRRLLLHLRAQLAPQAAT